MPMLNDPSTKYRPFAPIHLRDRRWPDAVLERLRHEDEKILIEMEKKYFGKLSFRADPGFHAEQFKIVNAMTNVELASIGG